MRSFRAKSQKRQRSSLIASKHEREGRILEDFADLTNRTNPDHCHAKTEDRRIQDMVCHLEPSMIYDDGVSAGEGRKGFWEGAPLLPKNKGGTILNCKLAKTMRVNVTKHETFHISS